MRTEAEQQQLIQEMNDAYLQNILSNVENEQEYKERTYYWKIDFKGSLHVPTRINFNPSFFVGTQQEYDVIYTNYLKGKEDEFKIIGEHKFDTLEDYNKKFGNMSAQ